MKKFLLYSAAAIALSFTSCSDNNSDDPSPVTPDPTPGTGLTAEDAKLYLEATAKEFINVIDNDITISKYIPAAHCFVDEYLDYDLPEELISVSEHNLSSPAKLMQAVVIAAKGNPSSLSRGLQEYTYDVRFSDNFGIYEPNSYRRKWVRTSDNTSDIQFVFTISQVNKSGRIVITPDLSSTSEVEYDETYSDEYYDYASGKYVTDVYRDNYIISVPKSVRCEVYLDNEKIADLILRPTFNEAAKNMSVTLEGNVSNVTIRSTTNITNTQITSTDNVTVGATTLASSTVRINGNNLCDRNKIESSIENDFSHNRLTDYITSGSAESTILNRLMVNSNFKARNELLDVELHYWGDGAYSSFFGPAIPAEATETATLLNSCISIEMSNTSMQKLGSLTFKPIMETYGEYWYCDVEPMLLFSDGTTYEIEEYFDKNFDGYANQFLNILSSYERMWNRYSSK